MGLFKRRPRYLTEVKSISLAANVVNEKPKTFDDSQIISYHPFVEAQTHITKIDWESVEPAWKTYVNKPVDKNAPLPKMEPQEIIKKHRGSADIFGL